MSKFNVAGRGRTASSPVQTTEQATRTAEGGTGFVRDAKSELFTLAVANMVGEDTFYEGKNERDQRFRDLVRQVTLTDPAWVAKFVPFLRNKMNMRTASVVMAAEYAMALRTLNIQQLLIRQSAPSVRQVISSALVRADEPAEFVAYWRSRNPQQNSLPGGVQRGVADAVARLYTERNVLKYDGNSRAYRFADIIELVRPTASAPWQDDLFRLLLDERHHKDDVRTKLENLNMLGYRRWLESVPKESRRELLRMNEHGPAKALERAGFTWESLSGYLPGGMDGEAWQWIIPSMGIMALVRNLRNFDNAGIKDEFVQMVAAKISDLEEVKRSRMFPFRFLSAYQAVQNSLRWSYPLECALQYSLSNVPSLPGRTLILVDRSGSMFWDKMSKNSDLTRADGAAVFGSALALRAQDATLVQYGTGAQAVAFRKTDAVLSLIGKFGNMGGTNTALAVSQYYNGHNRIVIVTDEQAYDGHVFASVPSSVHCYTWNLAGYKTAHNQSGTGRRHTFAGLSDVAFRMIPLLEAGASQDWDKLFSADDN